MAEILEGPTGPTGPIGDKGEPALYAEAGDQGSKGNRGFQGFDGEKGEQGIQGEDGEAVLGEKGQKGETGEYGYRGPRGDTGPALGVRGYPGIEGPIGAKGPDGDKGTKGSKGIVGGSDLVGPAGAQGEAGLQGDKGIQGIQGPIGDQGSKGDKGTKGDKGLVGFIGIQGLVGMVGDQGPVGDQGSIGPTGEEGPAGLRGKVGPPGDIGDTGPTGNKGTMGAKGVRGIAGIQGFVGPTGQMGPTGPSGNAGQTGDIGVRGDKGEQGAQGDKGIAGIKGIKGYQGPRGDKGHMGGTGERGLTGIEGPTTGSVEWAIAGPTLYNVGDVETGESHVGINKEASSAYALDISGNVNVDLLKIGSKTVISAGAQVIKNSIGFLPVSSASYTLSVPSAADQLCNLVTGQSQTVLDTPYQNFETNTESIGSDGVYFLQHPIGLDNFRIKYDFNFLNSNGSSIRNNYQDYDSWYLFRTSPNQLPGLYLSYMLVPTSKGIYKKTSGIATQFPADGNLYDANNSTSEIVDISNSKGVCPVWKPLGSSPGNTENYVCTHMLMNEPHKDSYGKSSMYSSSNQNSSIMNRTTVDTASNTGMYSLLNPIYNNQTINSPATFFETYIYPLKTNLDYFCAGVCSMSGQTHYLTRYNTSTGQWYPLYDASGNATRINGEIKSMILDNILGGDTFTQDSWNNLAVQTNERNSTIYVSGTFTSDGGSKPLNCLAKYSLIDDNQEKGVWTNLGSPPSNGSVYFNAMMVDNKFNDQCNRFISKSGNNRWAICLYDNIVKADVDSSSYYLTKDFIVQNRDMRNYLSNRYLFCVGPGDLSGNNKLAIYNTQAGTWTRVLKGPNGTCTCITRFESNSKSYVNENRDELYIGGEFTEIYNVDDNGVINETIESPGICGYNLKTGKWFGVDAGIDFTDISGGKINTVEVMQAGVNFTKYTHNPNDLNSLNQFIDKASFTTLLMVGGKFNSVRGNNNQSVVCKNIAFFDLSKTKWMNTGIQYDDEVIYHKAGSLLEKKWFDIFQHDPTHTFMPYFNAFRYYYTNYYTSYFYFLNIENNGPVRMHIFPHNKYGSTPLFHYNYVGTKRVNSNNDLHWLIINREASIKNEKGNEIISLYKGLNCFIFYMDGTWQYKQV